MNGLVLDIHLLRSIIINSITAGVALGLALNRRRNPELQPVPWPANRDAPFIEIIIPARDEERNIEPLLNTLARQAYPSDRFRITVVNDNSTDATAQRVQEYANQYTCVRLVDAPQLPAGWTGKNHAMHAGYVASFDAAEYLLFVDADTRHHPLMLSSVAQRAAETHADLLSLVIAVDMEGFWERVIVPQAGELYTLLVGTMDSVNRDGRSAAANGQFMLMKRSAYEVAISEPQVQRDVAEDRAIAMALIARGHTIRLEYGRELVRARVYSSFKEIWEGYTKTMFWASGHDLPKTLVVASALVLYAFMPLISLGHALFRRNYRAQANALHHAPLQLLPMLVLRAVVCRSLGLPAIYALTYPLAVAVGDAMLLFSLYRVLSGKGVRWKGRTYR